MELLPGVAPAVSEPKFNESSSISEDLMFLSNSSCRKWSSFSYCCKLSQFVSRSEKDIETLNYWTDLEVVMRSVLDPRTRQC